MNKRKIIIGLSCLTIGASLAYYGISTDYIKKHRYTPIQVESNYQLGVKDGLGSHSALRSDIAKYTNDINSLIAEKQEKTTRLNTLKTRKENLIQQSSNLSQNNDQYKEQLQQLNTSIANLKEHIKVIDDQVLLYNDLISNIQEETFSSISFMDDDGTVLGVLTCANGQVLSEQVNPTSTQYREFLGWYIDNNLVDLNTLIFNENTTLHAKYQYRYDVHFKIDDQVIKTVLIDKGSCASIPELPDNVYSVSWWNLAEEQNQDKHTNVSGHPITQETTFVAVGVKHYVTYNYYDQNGILLESNREVEGMKLNKLPNTPTIPTGNIFIDWYASSTKIHLGAGSMNYYAGSSSEDFYPIFMKEKIVVDDISTTLTYTSIEDGTWGKEYQYTYSTNAVWDLAQKDITETITMYANDFEYNATITLKDGTTVTGQFSRNGKYIDGKLYSVSLTEINGYIEAKVYVTSGDWNLVEDVTYHEVSNFKINSITYMYK